MVLLLLLLVFMQLVAGVSLFLSMAAVLWWCKKVSPIRQSFEDLNSNKQLLSRHKSPWKINKKRNKLKDFFSWKVDVPQRCVAIFDWRWIAFSMGKKGGGRGVRNLVELSGKTLQRWFSVAFSWRCPAVLFFRWNIGGTGPSALKNGAFVIKRTQSCVVTHANWFNYR